LLLLLQSYSVDGTLGHFSSVTYDSVLGAFIVSGSYLGTSKTAITLLSYNGGDTWSTFPFPYTLPTGILIAGNLKDGAAVRQLALMVAANSLVVNTTAVRQDAYELPTEPMQCNSTAVIDQGAPPPSMPHPSAQMPDGDTQDESTIPTLSQQDIILIVIVALVALSLFAGTLYHIALWRKHKRENAYLVDFAHGNAGEHEV
jgi:hypothetical protein